MIAQIEGKLIALDGTGAIVQIGQICYEVMLPGYAISALGGRIGTTVTLCTMEYLEGYSGGGNIVPRMIGFLSRGEKEFFLRFTSVSGIGIKKGLKSLSVPIGTIANAVEAGDEKILTALPGIGKRMAQVIIAELKGKLKDFAAGTETVSAGSGFDRFQTEALEILIAWGEKRAEAFELIELASRKYPQIKTSEELVPLVYRIKQGIEV